ncbi:MAG: type II toxin-antitoxin system death-on-curing family toxin [Akkermansiaceae bacterium]|jgi:death-on-curing protein|nr:type II toxin-antitoxin system death-on-curing family toxin [Akkermansiaceae bacterium]
MTEPIWIDKDDCLGFHSKLLACFGGLDGLRDEGLLESALERPRQLFHYTTPTLFEMAAAYAHGIVKNHPFLDGNKRSGLMAAALFLEMNGWDFVAPEEEAVIQTLALAAGEEGAEGYAAWLERSCVPRAEAPP